jgi:hypothetical protein
MTDDTADKIAALEKEVAALKAKVEPPKSTFVPISDEEHRDRMHQLRERNASVIPPWLRDACAGGVTDADCADLRQQSHRPTGRPGFIPEQPSNVRGGNPPGGGTGWQNPIPLSNPPGVAQADKLMDEQDRRDKAELAQRLGALKR